MKALELLFKTYTALFDAKNLRCNSFLRSVHTFFEYLMSMISQVTTLVKLEW